MFFDELSNDEWAQLSALVSDEPAVRLNRRGRPRAEPRIVANAVLWILTTGEPWSKLPGRYPSGPTCRRRFEEWQLNGTLTEMVRQLSQGGRTFAYVPEPGAPVSTPKPVVEAQPHTPAPRDDGMRGVFWKSPESWQTASGTSGMSHREHVWRSLDPMADITRQLSGEPADEAHESADAELREDREHIVNTLAIDCERRPVWMNMTSRGTQIADQRGYVIYVAVEQVPNAMFRAWAEIMKDGHRVERSGLIGPRFAQADAAREFAMEWAGEWIERNCKTLAAVPGVVEAEAMSDAAANANGSFNAVPAAPVAVMTGMEPANDETLPSVEHAPRTLPPVRTVPEVNHPANAHVAAYTNACRVALRRYPTNATEEAADNNAADRFPKTSQLVSHVVG